MEPRPIAEFTDWDSFIAALRACVAHRQVTHERLDEIAGLQAGYASKLLAPMPLKNVGPMSFTSLLGAVGVRGALFDDPEALARVQSRLVKRERPAPVHAVGKHAPIVLRFSKRRMRKLAKLGGKARNTKLRPSRRRAIARKAARARWHKPKVVEIKL